LFLQGQFRCAGDHGHLPWLDIGTRWCMARHIEQSLDQGRINRPIQKGADGASLL